VVLVVAVLGLVGWRVLKNTSHAGSNCIGTSYLNIGSRGTCVSDLQNILNGVNPNNRLIVSGLFDEKTQTAVINFQKLTALKVNPIGTAESTTWQKLCNTAPIIKNQVVQDAQSDACGKSNFSVVTPKTISTNYQMYAAYHITKDSQNNILVSSENYDGCNSNISVINPSNYSLSKVIKVNNYSIADPTVDSYGNVWAIGDGLCKGGPNPSLLKINIASGKIINNINIGSLPNSGKSSYTYMSDLNADKNGNLYALGTYWNGNFSQTDLIRLSADDASLLENYDSLLPQANKNSAPFYSYQMDSKGHLWVYSEFSYSNGTYNTVTTLIDPLSSSSSSSQVGSVLKTYNNLSHGLIDLAHNKSYVSSFDYSVGPPSEDQGIYDLSSDNGINGKLKNVGDQGLVDSNNNLWFLNAGTNLMKGGPDTQVGNTYVPSSISFVNGSNGATKVFKDSSFGIFAPLDAVQDGNNIWVLNMGPYDYANQVSQPTITIMNVNTQSLVKVLYNHQ
jgi:hypothetical protein